MRNVMSDRSVRKGYDCRSIIRPICNLALAAAIAAGAAEMELAVLIVVAVPSATGTGAAVIVVPTGIDEAIFGLAAVMPIVEETAAMAATRGDVGRAEPYFSSKISCSFLSMRL